MLKTDKTLIAVENVQKSFKKNDRQSLLVLDNVNFKVNEGEIIALLGTSGSGKSTLLRIIAGLIKPDKGQTTYRDQIVTSPVKGVSMVFQSFALLPWLTVLQNVELGLEAQGISRDERRQRALDAIDVIGLDGFETAYPKELSGGMRQRVGFARALVVNPKVLLMDEPFSALDVLTADNLRNDLLDLWAEGKTNIKSILFVTHNISEAVLLADRILIFGTNPGYIREELIVELARPRNEDLPEFRELVDQIYTLMTKPFEKIKGIKPKPIGIGYRLPQISVAEITGFLDTLNAPEYQNKKVDLPELADELTLDVDELLQITDVLEILRFANVTEGDIMLSEAGKRFVESDIQMRKQIFAEHLLRYVPLARHVRQVLDERHNHRASQERFLNELEDHLSEDTAEEVIKQVIDWGRYAEIFAFDFNTNTLSLENPE